MKKIKINKRKVMISLAVLLFAIICGFAEIGVAMVLNIQIQGLDYLTWCVRYYGVPWRAVASVIILGVMWIFGTETVYREVTDCSKD